jgi:hypothetical protein
MASAGADLVIDYLCEEVPGRVGPVHPSPSTTPSRPPATSVTARSGSAIELAAKTAPLNAFGDPPAESSIADAEQAFALRLLEQVDQTDGAGNVTIFALQPGRRLGDARERISITHFSSPSETPQQEPSSSPASSRTPTGESSEQFIWPA